LVRLISYVIWSNGISRTSSNIVDDDKETYSTHFFSQDTQTHTHTGNPSVFNFKAASITDKLSTWTSIPIVFFRIWVLKVFLNWSMANDSGRWRFANMRQMSSARPPSLAPAPSFLVHDTPSFVIRHSFCLMPQITYVLNEFVTSFMESPIYFSDSSSILKLNLGLRSTCLLK